MTGNTPSDDEESTVGLLTPARRCLLVLTVALVLVALTTGATGSLALGSDADTYVITNFDDKTLIEDDFWNDWDGDTGNLSGGGELTANGEEVRIRTNRISETTNISEVEAAVTLTETTSGSFDFWGFYLTNAGGSNIGYVAFDQNSGGFQAKGASSTNSGSYQVGVKYRLIIENIDYASNSFDARVINTSSGGTELDVDNFDFDAGNVDAGRIEFVADTGNSGETGSIQIHSVNVTNPARTAVYELSGKVTDATNGTAIEGATVDITEANLATQTGVNGRYRQGGIENGTYDVTVSAPGYANQTATVTIDGQNEVQDFQLEPESQSLEIETRRHLEHGETAEYTVTFRNQTGSDTDAIDVTEQATVTSLNTTVLTVNENRVLVVATNDTSINTRTKVRANYTAGNGETYTATQNVTVANLTANNLKILPTGARLEAALEGGLDSNRDDRTVVVILIATMFGVAAAILATSFAGVAIMCLTMIAGWLGGWVGNGMVMVAVLAGMFIGLNVAANIDYSTIRNR